MLSARTSISLPSPGTVLDALGEHVAEHGFTMERDGARASIVLPMGRADFEIGAATLGVEAAAGEAADIEAMIGFVASHVHEFARPFRPEIVWEGDTGSGTLFADFREMRVLRVTDLSPHMRRITLTGSDLARFATDEALHVRLFFPPPGVNPPRWPQRGADGLAAEIAPELRPVMRRYTIRRIDLASGEVDIDFVIHDEAGPGSGWAARAAVGDLLGMAGPGGGGFRPAEWYLLAGDETALPAIARILEALPAEAEGVALVSVSDSREAIPLDTASRVDVRYLDRSAAAPGAKCLLAEAVRAIVPPQDRASYVWAGCEYDDFRDIRAHFKTTLKRKRGDHLAVSYWRNGRAEDERGGED